MKEQENAFQLYHQTIKESENLGGLGIGLPLSKMLVELHGGRFFIISKEDKGSTVGFSIPLGNNKNPESNS